MKELHPDIRRLREREHVSGGAFFGGEVGGLHGDDLKTEEDGPEDAPGELSVDLDLTTLDAPAFDLAAFDFDLRVFDGLEVVFSSIDSGVDSGGGGGGDGGGGGGGGG